jgi:hypothetical protein
VVSRCRLPPVPRPYSQLCVHRSWSFHTPITVRMMLLAPINRRKQSPERVYLTNGLRLAPDYVGNRTGAGVDAVAPKLLRHAPFARTLLAARWINFATGLGGLFDSRKSGAVARRTDNFCLGFGWLRSSHKLIVKSFSSRISLCRYAGLSIGFTQHPFQLSPITGHIVQFSLRSAGTLKSDLANHTRAQLRPHPSSP